MKLRIDNILFYIFVIATLLMGAFTVGAVSVRIYVSIFVLLWALLNRYKFRITNEIKLYFLFVALYLVNLLLNGEIYQIDLGKYFLGRYFVCFSAIYITFSMLNNVIIINRTIGLLVTMGAINGVVNVYQFIGNVTALSVPLLFRPSGSEIIDLDVMTASETAMGVGVVGLFGNIVRNGYFSAVFAILSGLLVARATSFPNKIIFIGLTIFLIYTVFLTQQRFVLLLVLAFYFYYLNTKLNKFLYTSLIVIMTLLYYNYSSYLFTNESLGRYNNMSDEGRLEIYGAALRFLSDNVIFGGQLKFGNEMIANGSTVVASHNFFLNAFIYSGLLGGVVIIGLFFRLISHSIGFLTSSLRKNKASVFLSAALMVYLLNSLTHNASLVTGDEHIWMLYGLLIKSVEFELV